MPRENDNWHITNSSRIDGIKLTRDHKVTFAKWRKRSRSNNGVASKGPGAS